MKLQVRQLKKHMLQFFKEKETKVRLWVVCAEQCSHGTKGQLENQEQLCVVQETDSINHALFYITELSPTSSLFQPICIASAKVCIFIILFSFLLNLFNLPTNALYVSSDL